MSEERADRPRYLSVPEAAEYLRVSVSLIRKETGAGNLPHAKIGVRVVYDRVDLDEYVRRKKVKAAWRARGVDV